MAKRVAFHTLGCKLNFSETSYIANQFKERLYTIVEDKEIADIYIINSCTVTKDAENECRHLVRKFQRLNPEAYIAVIGCYAQIRAEEIAQIDGIDAVLGNDVKFKIFETLPNFEKTGLPVVITHPTNELNDFGMAFSTDADNRTRAFLKIQDGCDYVCSYCTIPMARGKSRSIAPENVLELINNLIDKNYKEIILTGVNVGDYKYSDKDFYYLLKQIDSINKDFRVRISSIEPNLLTEDIIKLTANSEKICNHFHIPLQNGSEKILKLMQRRYNKSTFENVVNNVHKFIPDCGLGIDVIVGFPSETDEAFNENYDFLKSIDFSYLHVFTYSERPDTKAISIEGLVDKHLRKERNSILRNLSDKKRFEFFNKMLGKEQKVLFEHTNYNGLMKGFTDNYIRVSAEFKENYLNEFCSVSITEIGNTSCKVKML